MKLCDDEKAMLDGAEGPAVAAAMDLLVRYGEALDCDGLCDVRNVAGTMTQPSPAKSRLVADGGWHKAFAVINLDCDDDIEIPDMRVPTCQLQHGFGEDAAGVVPYPADKLGGNEGLGFLVVSSLNALNAPRLFAVIIMLAALGFVLFFGVTTIKRFVIPWHESVAGRDVP